MTNTLAIGDLLTRPKLGFIDHIGVYLGSDWVVTNTPEKGEHLTSVHEFAAGKLVRVQPMRARAASVVTNAWKVLARPKRYVVVSRNCEHTAHEIVHGKAKSPTLMVLGMIGFVVMLLLLLRRS